MVSDKIPQVTFPQNNHFVRRIVPGLSIADLHFPYAIRPRSKRFTNCLTLVCKLFRRVIKANNESYLWLKHIGVEHDVGSLTFAWVTNGHNLWVYVKILFI